MEACGSAQHLASVGPWQDLQAWPCQSYLIPYPTLTVQPLLLLNLTVNVDLGSLISVEAFVHWTHLASGPWCLPGLPD